MSPDEFLGELSLLDRHTKSSDSIGGATGVILSQSRYSPQPGDFESSDRFMKVLAAELEKTAEWIRMQSPEAFARLRAAGLQTRLYIDMWIDQNQLDLEIPWQLSYECGIRQIPVYVITNE